MFKLICFVTGPFLFTHLEKSCSGQFLLAVPHVNCMQCMNCAETDAIGGMQWHNMLASLSTSHISWGADPSSNLEQTAGAAGFQSQESAFLQELLPPICHIPFLCLLATTANSAQHFAGFSLRFSVEFSFEVLP